LQNTPKFTQIEIFVGKYTIWHAVFAPIIVVINNRGSVLLAATRIDSNLKIK
jgi:hypothetical protein